MSTDKNIKTETNDKPKIPEIPKGFTLEYLPSPEHITVELMPYFEKLNDAQLTAMYCTMLLYMQKEFFMKPKKITFERKDMLHDLSYDLQFIGIKISNDCANIIPMIKGISGDERVESSEFKEFYSRLLDRKCAEFMQEVGIRRK